MTAQARRVFVLGHAGMLGHVVSRRAAERGWSVAMSDVRYRPEWRNALVEQVRNSGADIVINCLGRTPQGTRDTTELMTANALFPVHLRGRMRPHQYLLHASTDCVFEPTGGHRVDESQNATDEYGISKALGESVARSSMVTVIRVSVVGPSPNNARGLLEWFLKYPADQPVPGWADHRWNGITTLDWADHALDLAERQQRGETTPTFSQPGTTPMTKYELLCAFRERFRPSCVVARVATGTSVDRTLVPTEMRAPLVRQLQDLEAWYVPHIRA